MSQGKQFLVCEKDLITHEDIYQTDELIQDKIMQYAKEGPQPKMGR